MSYVTLGHTASDILNASKATASVGIVYVTVIRLPYEEPMIQADELKARAKNGPPRLKLEVWRHSLLAGYFYPILH